jgi:hypothetical protein
MADQTHLSQSSAKPAVYRRWRHEVEARRGLFANSLLSDPIIHAPRWVRCHGTSLLPDLKGVREPKKKYKSYPIGQLHVDVAQVPTREGWLYPFLDIELTSKYSFTLLVKQATRRIVRNSLCALALAIPYEIDTVLTDNGTHSIDPIGDG